MKVENSNLVLPSPLLCENKPQCRLGFQVEGINEHDLNKQWKYTLLVYSK